MAGRNFREKKQQQSRVFRRYFLCLHSRGKQRKGHSEWLKTKEKKFVEKKNENENENENDDENDRS